MKLTCGSVAKITRLAATFPKERFAVFGGQADFLLGGLASGGSGCIGAFGNVMPRSLGRVYALWSEGRGGEALRLQRVLSLAEASCKGGVASTKYAAALTTGRRAEIEGVEGLAAPRAPYEEPDDGVKARIREMVEGVGGLEDGCGEMGED